MRIIAGQWRGRALVAPGGQATRPTADRTREALFSMLTSRLGDFEGLRVADLFAGTGALGLEALSRGAAHCTFVEQDRAALASLTANIERLGASDRATVRAQSALSVSGEFDLVMLDPPYDSGFGQQALTRLLERGAIGPGTLVSLETGAREDVAVPGLSIDVNRLYGKARLWLLRSVV